MGLELRLFGKVQACWGGRTLELGGSRTRAVLAVLVLHAGQAVSHDRLVAYAWQADSAEVDELLSACVYRLREALAPACDYFLVRSVREGFIAEIDKAAVDAHRFLALLESVGSASGADTESAVNLRRALDLWHGQTNALVDLHSDWLRAQARILEERRLDAIEHLARLELSAGRPQQAVTLLGNIDPASERHEMVALLIHALLRVGQGARAVQVAHTVTAALSRENRHPGPVLDAALQNTLGTHPSRRPLNPRQLPVDTALFTGREEEIDRLLTLVNQIDSVGSPGTVLITAIAGMGGIGKTALATHAAHRLADRFPDGQLFLDLHGFTQGSAPRDPRDALAMLLGSLGVPPGQIPADLDARAALYRDRLAGTRTLILLDNAADEAQVRPLLPATRTCLVLVTSRKWLKALDDALPLPLDVLAPGEAVVLLRKAARLDGRQQDQALLERAAELCGRVPLALLIAGALLRTGGKAWNLPVLIDRLAARQPGRELAGYSDQTRNLAAVFDLSYRNLPKVQRRLFRRLGLLPGPEIDAYAAAALLNSDPQFSSGLLQQLADHSLLADAAPGRYRPHDLIRAHARTLAVITDLKAERAAAQGRLLHYYAHTAQTASLPIARLPRPGPFGPIPAHAPDVTNPQTARTWLRTEYANLHAAHAHATDDALEEHAIALATGLAEILQSDGPWAHALEIHQAAADAAEHRRQPAAHANALTDLGRMRYQTGDYPGATDALSRALEIYRQTGNSLGEANALTNLGRVRYHAGYFPAAVDVFAQALEIYRQIGDSLGEANALTNLGYVRHLAGAHPRAGDDITRALEIFRQIGNRRGEANALNDLGYVRYLTGQYAGATEAHTRALEIYREIDHRMGEANALTDLGHVGHKTGDYPEATHALGIALKIYCEIGDRRGEATALNYLGRVRHLTGDFTGAAEALERALQIYRQTGNRIGEAGALTFLGRVRSATGNLSWAADAQALALEIFRNIGDRIDEAWVLTHYAATIATTGDHSRALALFREALAMNRALNEPSNEALCLEGIAEYHLATGSRADGIEHLREALQIYHRLGMRADTKRVTASLDGLCQK